MKSLARLDQRYVWHPFTQMQDWLRVEPLVIVRGKGPYLWDEKGRRYLDANASIWTNLHGHRHPVLDRAAARQLRRISHCSALGLANEPASRLAEQLVRAANPPKLGGSPPRLSRVFFSDNGSTALEVATKQAHVHAQRSSRGRRPRFVSLDSAYHGDTLGAVSLGHIDLFHETYRDLLFRSERVMAPYCYRCPYNRAKPQREDAREYRRCRWECIDRVEDGFAKRDPVTAFVFEPLMQGAAGMIPQPEGWLRKAVDIARGSGALLIADEVFTGFGRTGELFACHREGVQPDFLCLAKGLSGGYVPFAATLTTSEVFASFLGEYEEFKTFFHGHSYTANPLGAAISLASLGLVQERRSVASRRQLRESLARALARLWAHPHVGDVRQVGVVAGIELVRDWRTRSPFDLRDQIGRRVCDEMRKRGVLTRPIGNVIPLIPTYATRDDQVETMVDSIVASLDVVLGRRRI